MEDNNLEILPETVESGASKRGKYKRQRNLVQYRDLSDEQFEERMSKKAFNADSSKDFEERIAKKWAEFEEDYDLSDLKINDKDALRALIQAQISLEDYEQALYRMRKEGVE